MRLQDEIDLRIVAVYVWKRSWMVAVSTLAFIGLGIAYIKIKQPRYLATCKFAVETSEDKSTGQLRNLAALAGINVGGGSSINPELVFMELLQDDEFLGNVLRRKWLVNGDSLDIPSLWKLQTDTTLPDWEYRLAKQEISKLRDGKYIKLEKSKTTGISLLQTLFTSPELTYQVNVYVLKAFDEYMVRHQITQAGVKTKFIDARIKEIAADLRRSEESLADFQMRNKNVTIPSVMIEQLRLKRNMEINQELFLQLKKQLELSKIEEKNDQPITQIISNPVVPVDPFKPNRKLVMGASCAAGLVAGFGLIFAGYLFAAFRSGRSGQHA